MKKILYLAACCAAGAVAAVVVCSCRPKALAATPGLAAKQYAEHIMNDDYDAFVKAISFTEPVAVAEKPAVDKSHATALRTIHHSHINERGGIKEIKLVSEKFSPDNKTCDVVLASHYNDGLVKTINMHMVNDYEVWKIRETPYKEIWRATTSEGDTEVIKVRTGHERDFIKDKNRDTGEKQFIKDINRHNGEVEVIKVLENGQRHREVIRTMPDGTIEAVQVR
jgi:uncharacterized protein YdaT